MQEQLVSFKVAKLAKEKGFDNIHVDVYYHINKGYTLGYAMCISEVNKQTDGCLLAPTQSLLQKWLREKHNILVEPCWEGTHEIYSINYRIIILGNTIYKDFRGCFDGQSYEQALEEGLYEALTLIKNE